MSKSGLSRATTLSRKARDALSFSHPIDLVVITNIFHLGLFRLVLASHTNVLQSGKVGSPEQLVHTLQRDSFRLWNPEGQYPHNKAEGSIDEIRPVTGRPAGRNQHDRADSRDDEIEQPLGCSRQRDVLSSQAVRGDLGDVNPAHRSPAELEGRGKEVHCHEGHVSGRRDGSTWNGRVEADIKADVKHADEHGEGGPDERQAPTQRVGKEGNEDGAGAHLDYAVNPGGEEPGSSSRNPEGPKDGRRVVVDGIGARPLLAHHQPNREKGALTVSRDKPALLLQGPKASPVDRAAFFL